MSDPVTVIGVNPAGVRERKVDTRDYPYSSAEVGRSAAIFDWNRGYDVEDDISKVLGQPFQLPQKNQGSAGSCGGEMISYYQQAIAGYFLRDLTEKSAKAPYSQVYFPGGGSVDRDLANISIKQGFYKESLVPSYRTGNVPPDEAFMDRPQDITALSRIDASKERGMLAYAFPNADIDTIAAVIAATKGIGLTLHGSNNGTWLSAEPKPPGRTEDTWNHFMYAGKAFLENGVKKIWAKQSWGPGVGINGWQKLDEEYFASGNIYAGIALLYNPVPTALPQHTFSSDLKLGDAGPEITALQTFLAYDGCFNLSPTGYYGAITEQAVLKFQIKYQVASLATLAELGGSRVGPATRKKLNELLQSFLK